MEGSSGAGLLAPVHSYIKVCSLMYAHCSAAADTQELESCWGDSSAGGVTVQTTSATKLLARLQAVGCMHKASRSYWRYKRIENTQNAFQVRYCI